ncbi:MAG TPA: tetratricopeptide repeat protein [Candidatus Aquabacterium excrementipullorum]|nr:tetratricopeptide repeat protein [Candidatus Aquabacterium excrementipullorum]
MATYDLEQQEQLDQAKHLWKKYGNLVTWVLVLALGSYAAWTGYLYWQNDKAAKAGGLYEELDRAVLTGDADKVGRVFNDLKDKYAGATFTEQGALLAARAQVDAGKADQAQASLQWLVDNGKNDDLVAVARLRLAGVLLDAKKYDEALKQVDAKLPEEFKPLADDRRGDILSAQGKKAEALQAYQAAWKAMDPKVDYRRFIEGKLTALGEPPAPSVVQGGGKALPPGIAPTH